MSENLIRLSFRAALFYFAVVFGFGFMFGIVRTIWIVPHIGARTAELMETPFMVALSFLAAQKIVRRFSIPSNPKHRLMMGFVALGLMLGAEYSLVLWLRGISLRQYFATRDPVSGTAYYAALLLFALAPVIVDRRIGEASGNSR